MKIKKSFSWLLWGNECHAFAKVESHMKIVTRVATNFLGIWICFRDRKCHPFLSKLQLLYMVAFLFSTHICCGQKTLKCRCVLAFYKTDFKLAKILKCDESDFRCLVYSSVICEAILWVSGHSHCPVKREACFIRGKQCKNLFNGFVIHSD